MGHLRRDKKLRPLIKRLPGPLPNSKKNPFHALIVAVLNQQISRKAAQAIENRLAEMLGSPFTPQAVAAASTGLLRSAGMSTSKAACAQASAKDALGREFTARSCRNVPDERIVDRVVAIKGAGPWTAHMVLIFGLGRPDVMPDGDGGIQRAATQLFDVEDLGVARQQLLAAASAWAPHRTVAAWYLWRSLGD